MLAEDPRSSGSLGRAAAHFAPLVRSGVSRALVLQQGGPGSLLQKAELGRVQAGRDVCCKLVRRGAKAWPQSRAAPACLDLPAFPHGPGSESCLDWLHCQLRILMSSRRNPTDLLQTRNLGESGPSQASGLIGRRGAKPEEKERATQPLPSLPQHSTNKMAKLRSDKSHSSRHQPVPLASKSRKKPASGGGVARTATQPGKVSSVGINREHARLRWC